MHRGHNMELRGLQFFLVVLTCLPPLSGASNPVVTNQSIADPHVHIFEGRAYMYAGRDKDPNSPHFEMPDWHVRSSSDLVHWRDETVIRPNQTYMGPGSLNCWAVDVAT